MVCKDLKTLFGFCGHIVSTTIHLRPCPLASQNDNTNNPQAQEQRACAATERYYILLSDITCHWCLLQEWSGPDWEERVGGARWISQESINNRLIVFQTVMTQNRLVEAERIELENALIQDIQETTQAIAEIRIQNYFQQGLDNLLEGVRRERIIDSVLRPVEGEPRESHCSICGEIYGAGENYEEGIHNPVLCRCGSNVPHEFGESCILTWLQTALTCPACRRELREESDEEQPDREG